MADRCCWWPVALAALALGGRACSGNRAPHGPPDACYGLALILGGAPATCSTASRWGRVTDFLEFYIGAFHWPTFNVADCAIVVGSGLLLLDLLRPKRQAART